MVHRGLLCNISDEISDLLDAYEEAEAEQSPKPLPQDPSQRVPAFLWEPSELYSKRGVEMWTGFLYSQPMWTFRGKDSNREDFFALMEVWNWVHRCKHRFAMDAALDCIRTMLNDHYDVLDDPMAILVNTRALKQRFRSTTFIMMDFMVSGKDAEKLKVWAFDTDGRDSDEEEVFSLKLEFQKKFNEDALVERMGLPKVNLMERCRYHTHGDGPCYLGPIGQSS